MKNVIIVIIFGVAGYFGYQYFIGSSQQDSASYESLPVFLEECQREGESLEGAIYDHKMGKLGRVDLNGYTGTFRRCLRSAGFTDSQIDETYDRIRKNALNK